MRLTLVDGAWLDPTDGAIIPYVVEKGAKAAGDAVNTSISAHVSHVVAVAAQWLATDGLMLATELMLIGGMACFLVAISGSAKWLERGTKYILISVGLGVIRIVGGV